jgi:hypothetical protein
MIAGLGALDDFGRGFWRGLCEMKAQGVGAIKIAQGARQRPGERLPAGS